MPIFPPLAPAQYDTVTNVLNSARMRLNDALKTLQPVSGKLLENSHETTLQALNNAWRKMQDCLADRGYARLINEVIIFSFPVVAITDPGAQVWLTWSGCFDGAAYFRTPRLPEDFTHPIKIWERWSSQGGQFGEPPMEKILDGLPAATKTTRLRFWEWRNDAIYMPGSMNLEDLRIRYVSYMPDFADSGTDRWFTLPVPIMRASDSLSWFLCAEVCSARGDAASVEQSSRFTELGKETLDHIFNLDVKADQRVNIRRKPRSGRGFGRDWY